MLDRSLLPVPRTFYEREGFQLTRANRGDWAMAKGQPPCHKSKSGRSLSVNLSHGGFRCFGCGAKGDLIKYVMLRDGCSFTTACKTLGLVRDGITAQERIEIARREREREQNRQRKAEQESAQRKERIKLRVELHTARKLYEQTAKKLHELGPDAGEDHWASLSLLLDDLRLTEAAYCRAAGLENPYE